MMLSFVVIFAALASSSVAEREYAVQQERQVSQAVVDAAHQSPLDFVEALRSDGYPVGLIITSDTWSSLLATQRSTQQLDRTLSKATLADVTATFVLLHQDWTVESVGTGVIVRDTHITRRTEVITNFSVTNIDAVSAFVAAERTINPDIPPVGGTVGSRLSNPDEVAKLEIRRPDRVSAYAQNASLEEVLMSIAIDAPRTSWTLVRHEDGDKVYDTLSVRYSDGGRTDGYSRLFVAERPN